MALNLQGGLRAPQAPSPLTPHSPQQPQKPGVLEQAGQQAVGAAAEQGLNAVAGMGGPLGGIGGALGGIASGDPKAAALGAGQEIAGQAVGAALTPVLGPLGPLAGPMITSAIGSLFNDGGMVGHRMAGGQFMGGIEHKGSGGAVTGMSPDTFINGQIKSKHYPTPAAAMNHPTHLNVGGPTPQPHPNAMVKGPLNPMGYNEGGKTQETPIKKVMDEQKLMQNQMAFDLDQQRKDEAHMMAMKQKQAAFAEGQKMKKEAATTTMSPAKPKAPLGGK